MVASRGLQQAGHAVMANNGLVTVAGGGSDVVTVIVAGLMQSQARLLPFQPLNHRRNDDRLCALRAGAVAIDRP